MTIKVLYRVQKGYRGLAKAIKVAIFMHAPPPAPSDQAIRIFFPEFLEPFQQTEELKRMFYGTSQNPVLQALLDKMVRGVHFQNQCALLNGREKGI